MGCFGKKSERLKYGAYDHSQPQNFRVSDLKLHTCDEVMPMQGDTTKVADMHGSVMRESVEKRSKFAVVTCITSFLLLLGGVVLFILTSTKEEKDKDTRLTAVGLIMMVLGLVIIVITIYVSGCFYVREKRAIARRETMMGVFKQYDPKKKSLTDEQKTHVRQSLELYKEIADALEEV